MAEKFDKATYLKKAVEDLLSLMNTRATAEVEEDKEEGTMKVSIDGKDETGLLIGRKGATINAIQAVLGMVLKQKTGEWTRVVVNVGDYREKQEEYLRGLARSTAERAKSTGEPQSLYNLSAAERRIIHLELSEDKEVETESTGEEPERYLVIKPKK